MLVHFAGLERFGLYRRVLIVRAWFRQDLLVVFVVYFYVVVSELLLKSLELFSLVRFGSLQLFAGRREDLFGWFHSTRGGRVLFRRPA